MKRKIAILVTLVAVAAAVCGAFAGCNSALTAEEGAQAVIDALAASKAFYTDYDKAEGYKYYTKFSTLSADGHSSETYYLNYQLGNEELGWEDFLYVQYTSTVTSAGASETKSEYLGDVLANSGAENVKENYIRVYTDNNGDNAVIKRMSEEEFLGREDINYLTIEYIMALFDNLSAENIKVASASVAGSVTTVVFTVDNAAVPIAAYNNISVRIMNDKITSVETYESDSTKLTLDYTVTYYAPDGSMPALDYSKV